MKLTVVFTVLGQHDIATLAIRNALECLEDQETNIVVVDNGGDYEFPDQNDRVTVERAMDHDPARYINMGVYPVFKYAMDSLPTVDGDVVAFFHSDLIVVEHGFDVSILHSFRAHPDLGLLGFVGSNEIDSNGGRGGGTTSNFQGGEYYGYSRDGGEAGHWVGSVAEAHGRRDAGYTNAAVVDGCAMIIRRDAWKKIGFRDKFPPHHFYDRLISTQMLEAGYRVAVLGIECDHLGGQTVSREQRYPDMAREWCERNVSPQFFVGSPTSWDMTVYREAEKQWLMEYRDRKHMVPTRV